MKEVTKDIAVRAFKTFLQAFIAQMALVNNPLEKQAVVAALAAAISATWNTLVVLRKS